MTHAPAPLLRRYTAWTLDAAAINAIAMVLMHRPLCAALRNCARALDVLSQTVAALMQRTLDLADAPWALLQTWMGDATLQRAITGLALSMSSLLLTATAAFALVALAWFTCFEGSRWQASPGKHALGMRVIDDDGLPPGFLRSGLRNAAGLLSWLSLNLGHLLAAHGPRHQSLHDRIAGSRVVLHDPTPMPWAARLWLGLQPVAFFALVVLSMHFLDQRLTAALDARLGP